MNGAEALLNSLIDAGVEVCFANPGTSEMQLVAAIDHIPGMRPILGLFEGVVTGAADGYGRMADKPAATLLHLGSGFSNGMANLHNAKRAFTPIVNLVGDHATYHLPLDAPLTSDVPAHASLTSTWVKVSQSAEEMGIDGVEAVAAAMEGRIANLIVPANHAWSDGGRLAEPIRATPPRAASDRAVADAADMLRSGKPTCLFLGGRALRENGLTAAARIAAATGATVMSEVFPARIQRGKGRPTIERLPYLGEMAAERLEEFAQIIVVGAKAPVSFFAYPGKPGILWRDECSIFELADQTLDQVDALERLADALQAPQTADHDKSDLPDIPDGPISAEAVGAVIANSLPQDAIVSDESNTSGAFSYGYFDGAAPHDWLTLTGGAIGQGLPVAVGAAVACPGRKVIGLQADGSGMYTNQALWTMAREDLDVCVVIFNNSAYAILGLELNRVGVKKPGERAQSMIDIGRPKIDWVKLAEGMGVAAASVSTIEDFSDAFSEAMKIKGPRLIEVVL